MTAMLKLLLVTILFVAFAMFCFGLGLVLTGRCIRFNCGSHQGPGSCPTCGHERKSGKTL